MSTRYLKRDNVVLVGVAKNGSQAIKQIYLRYDGFQLREQQGVDWNADNFIDWDDSNLLILFPIRHWYAKAYSEMLEVAAGGKELGKTFIPRLTYLQNGVMRFFVKNIVFNENWTGAKVRFFDLKKLSTHIPKYLGWNIEIPYYNTAKENDRKVELMEELKDVEIITSEVNELIYKGLQNSKYWINL